MSLIPTNSFNKKGYKKPVIKKERSENEVNNNSSFLSYSKKNEESVKIIERTQLNPKTCYQTNKNNVGNKGYNSNKEKQEININKGIQNKEIKEIRENRISIKNQNNEFNPNRIIKPKRNASVQQRKRINKNININLNSFFHKPAQQSSISGIIGLTNEGQNSDFINAVIQCLSNIGRFRIELFNLEYNKLSNKIITSSLVKVLRNLWLVLDHRIYSPKKFIEIINKNIKPNYNLKEFIIFLLENIHKELKNGNDNNLSNLIVKKDYNLANDFKYNFSSFQHFKNIYENLNSSIISKEFVGYLGILDFCEHCHQDNKITFKTFETLFFNIDDIIKTIQNNCVGIYQSFKYYERKRENVNCNKCNLKKYKKCDLWYMPSTLIITLNYGNNKKAKFIFEEYLNLTHFVICNKESPYYYELVGIIVNLENNQNGNHFISYSKNSNNCCWYKYDNGIVVRCSFIEVASYEQPSVLFFSYIEA
jgi:hypothetical protein